MKFRYNIIKFYLIGVFMIFALQTRLLGQKTENIRFDRISTENIRYEKGLSQNLVFAIMQDHMGFMWFGTWDGLNRYDGYSFKIYNKLNGLSNTTVRSLLEDNKSNLWIGTEDGVNILDLTTGRLIHMLHEPGNINTLSNNYINHIYRDRDGYFWFCTAKGLNQYNHLNHSFIHYYFYSEEADSIRSNWINKIIQDQSGNMWIGTRQGLFCYQVDQKTFLPYFSENNGNSISDNLVNDILQTRDGYIWVATRNGLSRLNPQSGNITSFRHDYLDPASLSNNNVTCLFQDSHDQLWVGTRDKLNLFDPLTGTFTTYGHTNKSTSLSNDDIYSIYEDRSGNIWVGTFKGVNMYNRNSSKFNLYARSSDEPNTLSNNIIYSIYKDDDGKIWIATAQGINILDRTTGKYELLHHEFDNVYDLAREKTRIIVKDHKGNFWIGSENHGLFHYNPEKRIFYHYHNIPEQNNSLISDGILYLMESSDHKIWIGTNNGLSILDPETRLFTNHQNDPKDNSSLSANRIWQIYEDHAGNIWISTNGGLNLYLPENGTFKRYMYSSNDPNSISSDKVFSVYQDNRNRYWVGTMGGGLNSFDREKQSFYAFTELDGLPNNVVYCSLEDEQGNLWLSTNWGLSKFNPDDTIFINYDIKDGLQSNEFNSPAYLKADDGEMFFGGMNGFNSFYPEEIGHNDTPPEVIISTFKIFNEIQPYSIEDQDTLILNYRDNFFSFEFSALDYSNPSKNKYQFKLENYDVDWIHRDADRRIAEYANIAPGTYKFKVIASNNDGVWNHEGLSFSIIIHPPWYSTWIFRILFSLFVVFLAWFLVYRRIKTIRKRHEVEKKVLYIEKQLFDIEQKALRLQMNPHFIFNSLNAIQSFVIASDTDKAIHYLSKFSQLMRLILYNSRESAVPIRDEIKALTYFMDIERLRFDNKFDYDIQLDPLIDEEFLAIPPMILQPYVENAILHGLINSQNPGMIRLEMKLEEDTVFCIIEDNGIGREEARRIKELSGIKRQSRGMMITQERLDLLNKQHKDKYSVKVIDLSDNNGNATGTRVEIRMIFEEL
ncbi:MAG: histidine kinase [Bacteroidetes bacterium]|nr:histidine kinase [Bacteroidota bacterium]